MTVLLECMEHMPEIIMCQFITNTAVQFKITQFCAIFILCRGCPLLKVIKI